MTVKVEQEIAAELLSAAQRPVKNAELGLINHDFWLADTFADALRVTYGRLVAIRIVGERQSVTAPEDGRRSTIRARTSPPSRTCDWSGRATDAGFR
jgi:hypothetical protein